MQYVRCGISNEAIGVIYIGVTILELLGGMSARLTGKFGAKRFGSALFMVCTAACIVLAQTQSALWSVLGVGMIHAAASLLWPLKTDLVNRFVNTPDRVTALSVNQLLCDGIAIGTNLAFGRLADRSLPIAMLLGAVLCGAGFVMFLKSQRA